MTSTRDQLLDLAKANEDEASKLAVAGPEARIEARGAAQVAKHVTDAILAELRAGLRDGSIASTIRREIIRIGIAGIDPSEATIQSIAMMFVDFATGRVAERYDVFGTQQVEMMLMRATAADVRALTLREQAARLRELAEGPNFNPQPDPLVTEEGEKK